MGLLQRLLHGKHILGGPHRRAAKAGRLRICRIEAIEPRQMLSAVAPTLNIGATYYQPHDGNETIGSLLYISWNGGAPGTSLDEILIDTHKVTGNTPQFTVTTPADGDVVFNTDSGNSGTLGGIPLSILQWSGTTQPTITVSNDSTLMEIQFPDGDFQPSGRLVLKVGFAIVQSWSGGTDRRVVEGADFDGTSFEAVLSGPHYETATATGFFRNSYSNPTTLGLDLPDENYDNASAIYTTGLPPTDPPEPVFTAGVLASMQQTPLPVTLSGEVYDDPDADNKLEPGDAGIPGATVTLYEQGDNGSYTVEATTVTDANGDYSFANLLPGTYQVVETVPSGYLSVGDTPGTVDGQTRGQVETATVLTGINLDGGDDSIQNDFANCKPDTVSGYVYYDAKDDGVMDPGDPGIANVEVIVENTATHAETDSYTNSAGFWSVGGLMPGQYQATEVQPAGYLEGTTTAGTVSGAVDGTAHNPGAVIDGITFLGGQAGVNYDFGELLPVAVSGYVYVDTHNNGIYEPPDTPIAGAQLTLLGANGNPTGQTAVTDSTGHYSFSGLMPGTYEVSLAQPAGYYEGLDTAGTINGVQVGTAHDPGNLIDKIALQGGQSGINYNFGELLPAGVSGYVYVDTHNNGIYEPPDTPIAGAQLTLLDANGNPTGQTATTDSSGHYSFSGLAPGTYEVSLAQPAGYYEGLDTAGTINGVQVGTAHDPGNLIDGIALDGGQSGINYNFGELLPASVSGYVYVDTHNNGIYEPPDTPIPGAQVTLLDAQGNATGQTAMTDNSGHYSFSDLAPGTYEVALAQPAGYYEGLDTAGTINGVQVGTAHDPGNLIDGIALAGGQSGINYNFGELQPATISGVVFVDNNGNGTLEANDTLLPGVTVYLLDSSGNQITSTTTDANGKYAFTDLLPGTYGTADVQPSGYLQGGDLVGNEGGTLSGPNKILGAQLGAGADGMNYDFYVVPPATISGYVFQDGPPLVLAQGAAVPYIPSVRDGQLTSGDTRLSGVVMQLCDATGYPLSDAQGNPITTTTDANGYYQFTNLAPGQYSVVEQQPTGYTPGVDTAGSQGGLVVDAYSQLSASILSTLAVTPNGSAIVKIAIPPGTAAVQYNFSEVLIQRQPPNPPPGPPTPTPPMPPFLPPYLAPPVAPEETISVPYDLMPATIMQPIFGGGSTPEGYSWHLSVVDAGQPRDVASGDDLAQTQTADSVYFDPVSWTGADMNQSEWTLADANGVPIQTIHFGMAGATPVTGDWDGSGTTKIGVFIDGLWFLDLNGNGAWDQGDLWIKLGHKGDQPVTGDWNGDGKTDIGIYGPAWVGDEKPIAVEPGLPDAQNPPAKSRPKNVPPDPPDAAIGYRTMKQGNHGRMRSDVIDHVFQYGGRGDIAVTGDWNGDGIYTIGIFHHGTWYLDMDGDGRWGPEDLEVQFGQDGDIPVVGDWTGDGITKLGVYRDGKFYLDVNNSHKLDAGAKVIELGSPGDKPVVGDWTGDGVDKVGVYHNGPAPAVPLQARK